MPSNIVHPRSRTENAGRARPHNEPHLLCNACGHDIDLGPLSRRCPRCGGTCWERMPPLIDISEMGLSAVVIEKIRAKRKYVE